LTKRIFTLLLRRGRQSIPALTQYTRLPPRHVRHGLAVLIQQNLVYYHVEHDSETTYYEANQEASYFLLRSGKIIECVSSQYGHPAQDIVQNLLFLGHAKIGDLLAACTPTQQPAEVHVNGGGKAKPLANGIQNSSIRLAEDPISKNLEDVMYQLLESGLVAPIVKSRLQSSSDLYNQVESEVLGNQFKNDIKGTKQKDELKAKIIERLRDIRSEGEVWQRKGAKRALNGVHMNGGEKRRKLTNGVEYLDSGSHALPRESNRLDVGFSSFSRWP
jgi:DNA-directed RNA polymerase III subunit RPC3